MNIDKHKRNILRPDNGLLSLHNKTDSLIKATAATNQNSVLSSAIAIKVINNMPI